MMTSAELVKKYATKPTKVIDVSPQLRSIRFSPCGKILVAGGYDARIRRWNFESPEQTELPALAGHHAWVEALALRERDQLLFSGDSWGQLTCWSNYTAEQPAQKWNHEHAHDGWIRDISVSPDGARVATCGTDRVARVWSADDGAKISELAAYGQDLMQVRYLPDGTLITGDDRGIVKHWNADGTLVREFNASALYALSRLQDVGGVHSLAVSADGKLLAAGGTVPKNGGTVVGIPTIIVFDVATGKQKQKLSLGTENDCFIAAMNFHADGFLSAISYGTPGQGQLLYIALGEEKPFFTLKLPNCHSMAWHPDGKRLAVTTTNGGSNGNGRPVDKEGKYLTNRSPIQLLELVAEA